jgi:serine/threonine protein kinase
MMGAGNFGAVYAATKKKDGAPFAIKRIGLPFDPTLKSAHDREIKALETLKHENIVMFYPPFYRFKEGRQGKYTL